MCSLGKIIKVLGVLLVLPVLPGLTQENSRVDLQVVKYGGLKDLVLKNRGQVVVVDFWHTL